MKELKYTCCAALFTLLLLSGCGKVIHKKQVERPVRVQVSVVAPVTVENSRRYVGSVEAVSETPLSMQSPGRVVAVYTHDGERVSKGQRLLAIDSTQAVNALRSAEASLRQAQDGYERVRQVHAGGAVTDQQMVEVESKLAQAQSMVAMARRQVDECTLRAPSEGVISGFDAQIGQSLLPGVRVLSLVDVSRFEVSFAVPETEVGSIAVGQTGRMSCAATGNDYSVRIREKDMKANPVAHTYAVRASVEGATKGLMPGMVATVLLPQSGADYIVVPAPCIHLLQSGASVWLVRNGCAERVPVEVAGYQANGISISSGLNAGDTIVVEGHQKLYNNCKVIVD